MHGHINNLLMRFSEDLTNSSFLKLMVGPITLNDPIYGRLIYDKRCRINNLSTSMIALSQVLMKVFTFSSIWSLNVWCGLSDLSSRFSVSRVLAWKFPNYCSGLHFFCGLNMYLNLDLWEAGFSFQAGRRCCDCQSWCWQAHWLGWKVCILTCLFQWLLCTLAFSL